MYKAKFPPMRTLGSILGKLINKQIDNKAMVGSTVLVLVKKFFELPYDVNGYVRNDIIFLKFIDHGMKIQVFLKKNDLLKFVNEGTQKLGFNTKYKDVRLK